MLNLKENIRLTIYVIYINYAHRLISSCDIIHVGDALFCLPKFPERSGEERLHVLQRLSLRLRQGEGEEDDGDEAAAGVEIPRPELESLQEVEEGLGYREVEGPVEAGGETDSLTSEPERIDLNVKTT